MQTTFSSLINLFGKAMLSFVHYLIPIILTLISTEVRDNALIIMYNEDVQRAWTMHPFHTAKLDIAGGRRSRNQCDGMRRSLPLLQSRDGLWNQTNHLLRMHYAQMPVGDQGQRPSSLMYSAIQDDSPRLSDSHGTTGEHTGALVQVCQSQRRIVSQRLHPLRYPGSW